MVVPYSFINIGVWNIHGLFLKVNNIKLSKLDDEEVQKRIRSFDIFCFQETQCGSNEATATKVPGYRMFPFQRKMSANNRHFGGSLLLIKNQLREGVKILESHNADKIWVKLLKSFFNLKKDLYFCFSYTPPLNSPYTKNLDFDVLQTLEEEIANFSREGNVLVGGDFNAKTGTGNDFVLDHTDEHSPIMDIDTYIMDEPQTRENRDTHSIDAQGETLLSLCKNSRMRILNGRTKGDRYGRFTRYPLALRESPSTLDYIITDTEVFKDIMSFIVLSNLGLSDHECVSVSIKTKGFSCPVEISIPVKKRTPLKCTNSYEFLRKLSAPLGKEKLNKFLENYTNATDFEEMTSDLVNLLNFASTMHTINKRANKKRKNLDKKTPWYSSECRKLKWCLNRAVKKYRKDPFNPKNQEELFSAKKCFKKTCKKNESKFRKKLTDELMSIENKNPTEFWKVIKKMRNWGSCKDDSSDSIDPKEWMLHFQKLLNGSVHTPQHQLDELSRLENTPFFSDLDAKITHSEIEKALKKLNKKASSGPDSVSGKMLCAGKEVLMPLLDLFFNKLFTHANQPKILSLNYLVTVFKKGELWDLDNYRGIAIGSALGKTFALI